LGLQLINGCNEHRGALACVHFYYIKFCYQAKFPYSENFKNFSADKSPARLKAGGAEILSERKENLIFPNELKFVSETPRGRIKPFQTFSIILPNLIHKSRKKNLKK